MIRLHRPALALMLLLPACASTKPTKSRGRVADIVEQRTGLAEAVDPEQDAEAGARVRARVDELLSKPLDVHRAVAIALLNNPGFQAKLEDLGVAQAELVQAGLLDNPVVGGDLVFSTLGNGLGGGFSVSQSLLSVFLIPAKRRVAKANLEHVVKDVGSTALHLVRDVKHAVSEVHAASAAATLLRQAVQAAQVADELAARQLEHGNTTQLRRALVASELDEARLELLDGQLRLASAREELSRKLGLWGKATNWDIQHAVPDLPGTEVELADLERRGIAERLDVSAARARVEGMEYALKLRRRGVIPQIEVGVEGRNEVGDDVGHEWVIGPSLAIEIPIFDPGNADFAALRAQLRQSRYLLQETAVDARAQIRVARETMLAARRRAEYYRDVVVPRHERITAASLEQYNGMLMGAFELFEIRADELEARRKHAQALADYWSARADLELAVGGRLGE